MTSQPLLPLERLQVTDGLLLTADRWQIAHSYHRQRQNLHFQALGQAGIVQGLGVSPVPAPAHVPSQYRDQRWLQVQPGLAIDAAGNPIVVPQPFDYRITAAPAQEPLWVYLVIRYVDPDQLEQQSAADILKETFRVEEKISPPDESEIELCRLWLQPGQVKVKSPLDCFAPGANEIDLRHRLRVCDRAQVRLGQLALTPMEIPETESLSALIQALRGLYPALQASGQPSQICLRGGQDQSVLLQQLLACDLLRLSYSGGFTFQPSETDLLREYLNAGGVLLVEMAAVGSTLNELLQVRMELIQAMALASTGTSTQMVQQALEVELAELEGCIQQEIHQVAAPLQALTRLSSPVAEMIPVPADHLLRTIPFRFARWPELHQTSPTVLSAGGLVLVVGELSSGWGGPGSLHLDRGSIRSVQEMGINLLHFAWQRRHLSQLSRGVLPVATAMPPLPSPEAILPKDPLERLHE